jgi:hypothetical protein
LHKCHLHRYVVTTIKSHGPLYVAQYNYSGNFTDTLCMFPNDCPLPYKAILISFYLSFSHARDGKQNKVQLLHDAGIEHHYVVVLQPHSCLSKKDHYYYVTSAMPVENSMESLTICYINYTISTWSPYTDPWPTIFLHSSLACYGTYAQNLSQLLRTYKTMFCLSATSWLSLFPSNIARLQNRQLPSSIIFFHWECFHSLTQSKNLPYFRNYKCEPYTSNS